MTDGDRLVWVSTTRRGIPAHQVAGERTACGRSMHAGHLITAAEATELYAVEWCRRCWPTA